MNFDRFFNFISYTVVFCGFLTLWVSGSIGFVVTFLFISALIAAALLEGTRWQLSERVGTVLIFVIVPIFYVGWKYKFWVFETNETAVAGILSQLILGLSVIKLFQRKADRDWLFLYLMAFFEVLLGAALSISPLYLGSFILYLFVTVLAIVTLDIRKTARSTSFITGKNIRHDEEKLQKTLFRKLPVTASILLFLIVAFAAPMFFMLPRVGGAGFGANQGGITGMTGFSDKVKLGEIGRIQQSDQVVMRVQIKGDDQGTIGGIRWRGVALDKFDNKTWTKSETPATNTFLRSENGVFRIFETVRDRRLVTQQTVYLEPLDTSVLFGLPQPVIVQGNFQAIQKDAYGGVSAVRNSLERMSYTVLSDRWMPSVEALRNDNAIYSAEDVNYLQIPNRFDDRIGKLAYQVTRDKTNRYDKARAIEQYLQTQFGYTLEQKSGGEQPLADFLFNVREGHCEYFATAMVMMLRTQGIAARIVNGFQRGEYNETADMYVVKQQNAHSWVEVYFPRERVWVTFDPTPSAGQNLIDNSAGILGFARRYLDALESLWIQYFVSYDNQEQRSLFRSMKSGISDFQTRTTEWLNEFQNQLKGWWQDVRGDKGMQASAWALARGALALILVLAGIWFFRLFYLRAKRLELWNKLLLWWTRRKQKSIVEFYERMERVLANRGIERQPHQTPLEFAFALKMPEAVSITEKYNRVRFGEKDLSGDETREIESWLKSLEKRETKS